MIVILYYMAVLLLFIAVILALVFSYCNVVITIHRTVTNMSKFLSQETNGTGIQSSRFHSGSKKNKKPELQCLKKNKNPELQANKCDKVEFGDHPTSRVEAYKIDCQHPLGGALRSHIGAHGYAEANEPNSGTTSMASRHLLIDALDVSPEILTQTIPGDNAIKHLSEHDNQKVSVVLDVCELRAPQAASPPPQSSDCSKNNMIQLPASGLTTIPASNLKARYNKPNNWQLKITGVSFLICLIFIITWLPPWIMFLCFSFLPEETKQNPTYLAINLFCKKTFLINTFTNPILYTALNKDFRRKLKKLIYLRR